MGIKFHAVITSKQAECYKPDLNVFYEAQELLGEEVMEDNKGQWLHVGESLYHDIGPANALGIDSVWVKRPDRGGGTRATDAVPSLTVPNLTALADAAGVA